MTDSLRILVAEDESLIRLDIVATLEESGFEVVAQADNGTDAIAMAEKLSPDLAVLDIKMPGADGIAVAERLAELDIPCVMLTAFSQSDLVGRAANAGAMAYLLKPFKPTELMPAIQVALSRHDEIKALEREIQDLSERLETRKLMDRAKGLLQSKMNLTEPEAFRWIQKSAMDRRLSMSQVAKTVIDQLGSEGDPVG
ncbi:MAG: hypothetical protein RL198_327 [Actinomycetota bacterium]|jgi:response regulator NasT